jgi:hypothetical protein
MIFSLEPSSSSTGNEASSSRGSGSRYICKPLDGALTEKEAGSPFARWTYDNARPRKCRRCLTPLTKRCHRAAYSSTGCSVCINVVESLICRARKQSRQRRLTALYGDDARRSRSTCRFFAVGGATNQIDERLLHLRIGRHKRIVTSDRLGSEAAAVAASWRCCVCLSARRVSVGAISPTPHFP